jgi:hypothetical protein
MSWKSKTELIQQETDEWMLRWRRFQTYEDFQIEKRLQSRRQRNFGVAGAVLAAAWTFTAAPSTINRMFGPPHTFDVGVDAQIKESIRSTINGVRRWTPNGYGRLLAVWVPTYLAFYALERQSQVTRMGDYLKAETIFGEQHRRRVNDGKLDEFLCVNVQATLPKADAVIYAK